jgi:EpsI family protein
MPMTVNARALIVSLFLLTTTGYLAWAARAEAVPPRVPLEQCPLVIADYRGQAMAPFDEETLKQLGDVEYLNRVYASPRRKPIGLYVGYYASQRAGDTIHSPQNCLPGAGWLPVSAGRLAVNVTGGKPGATAEADSPRTIEVNRYVIEKGMDRQVVLYWYQSHGRVVASEYWAKIYLTLDAVRMNRTDGAMIRVITPIGASEAEAEQEAVGFVKTIFPLLESYLPS